MPNIPPLITHTPDAQSLYAAVGSGGGGSNLLQYQYSADYHPLYNYPGLAIELISAMHLTAERGKVYLVQVQFSIDTLGTPPVPNTTDCAIVGLTSGGGGIGGNSLLIPLGTAVSRNPIMSFSCVVPFGQPPELNFGAYPSSTTALVNNYTFRIESLQLIEIASLI